MHVCSGDAVYIFFSGDDVYMFNLETLSVFMFILEMLGPLCVPIYCQAFCKKRNVNLFANKAVIIDYFHAQCRQSTAFADLALPLTRCISVLSSSVCLNSVMFSIMSILMF